MLDIKKSIENDTTVLSLTGRLDTATAPQFDKFVGENTAGVTKLAIDFKELEYISSAGLRVLLKAQKTMNAQGTMTVRNINSTISEILEVTGFSDILTIE